MLVRGDALAWPTAVMYSIAAPSPIASAIGGVPASNLCGMSL